MHLEQLVCSPEQRGSNQPVEMGLAALLIREGVNDRERSLADRDCEPSDGVRLLLNEWQRVAQKYRELVNLSRVLP